MPVKRRTAQRRAYDPADFLHSDGWSSWLLSGTPLLPSREMAAAAWERCRPVTWTLWAEAAAVEMSGPHPWPPAAARAFDGLVGIDDPRGVQRPVAAQLKKALAALAKFRKTPAAGTCGDALDLFEDHLRRAARPKKDPDE